MKGGAEKGSTIKFTLLGDFNPDMLVTHFEEPNIVGWTCTGGHPNWQDNTMSDTLREGRPVRFFTSDPARVRDDPRARADAQ